MRTVETWVNLYDGDVVGTVLPSAAAARMRMSLFIVTGLTEILLEARVRASEMDQRESALQVSDNGSDGDKEASWEIQDSL